MSRSWTWWTVGLAVGAAALAVSCGAGPCPCGSDPDQPLAEHDLSYAGEHTLDGRCACHCGPDGDLEEWPLDDYGTCDHSETECEDANGDAQELLCR